MKEKEEGINYGDDGIPCKQSEYMGGQGLNGCLSDMQPYYFFRPDLPMNRIQNMHVQNKYDMKYGDKSHFQHMGMSGYEEQVDQEHMRNIWKKEKNRLAAKKSREKKMIHLKELERREHMMIYEISELKEAVNDYDNILKNILEYIQESLGKKDKKRENFVFLFDCLCRLKKPGTSKPTYLHDVGHLFSSKLSVTNEEIDRITGLIRDSLNDLFDKN